MKDSNSENPGIPNEDENIDPAINQAEPTKDTGKSNHPLDLMKHNQIVDQQIKRRNFISFSVFFLLGGAGFVSYKWLYKSPLEPEGGITGDTRIPLRKALNKTELAFRRFFSPNHLVKTYPKSMAAIKVRQNSDIGVDDSGFKPENWSLSIQKGEKEIIKLSMKDINDLPKTEIVFDFKCVEGWDQIQYWGGVTFTDLIKHLGLHEYLKHDYVGMETPNGEYYVGLDMDSAAHPQTILAYEMNGKPLPLNHGAPLRLIIPVKYGIKNIKRIGSIIFSDSRPRDYWAERGYDYYSGL